MPDVAKGLGEAVATKGDVTIPIADYLTHIAGTPMEGEILPHMKVDPEGMTYAEGQAFYQTQQDAMTRAAEKLNAAKEQDAEYQQHVRAVRDSITKQLIDAGVYSDAVSKEYPKLPLAFIQTNARRLGISPLEFYQRWGAKIVGDHIERSLGDGFHSSPEEIRAGDEALKRDSEAWGKSVDAFADGTLPVRRSVTMLNQTPLVLQMLGAKNLPVNTTYGVLKKVLVDKHKLPPETVKQVPAAMADPVMVFKSATQAGDLVMMLGLKDQHGATVIVPMTLEATTPEGYTVNLATSVYGRQRVGTTKPNNQWFLNQIQDGNLLYQNKQKSRDWAAMVGLSLPPTHRSISAKNTVHTEADLVKLREANPELYQSAAPVDTPTFRNWFGDSKVVDATGKPLTLWHQTGADIEAFDPRKPGAGEFDNQLPFGIFMKPDSGDIGLPGKTQIPLHAKIENPLHVENRADLGKYLEANVEGYTELKQQLEAVDKEHQAKADELEAEAYKRFEEQWEPQHPDASPDEREAAINSYFNEVGLDAFMEQWHRAENDVSAQMKDLVDRHFKESGHDGIILERDEGGIGKKATKTYVALDPTQVKSVHNRGTFDPNDPRILYQAAPPADSTSGAPGRPWPENFPKVTQLTSVAKMKSHPDYEAAKSGDREAAARLVLDMMSGKGQREKLRALAEKYPDAILVAVHAEERSGRNSIPSVLSEYIGKATGLDVGAEIVQSGKVGRTGAGAWYRMSHRPRFDGPVEKGRQYILVDDVVTGGGTFSELRRYIEANGGEVVDMVSAGAARFGTNIALTPQTRLALEDKFGVESLQQFLKEADLYGGNHHALTESEARTLLAAGSLDAARD
ncbi:MAG: hypothetical protein FWG62_08605, partial [Proteobacteria bacterium]|nr:hypothetical protein [Pseudomonadota bacterium]